MVGSVLYLLCTIISAVHKPFHFPSGQFALISRSPVPLRENVVPSKDYIWQRFFDLSTILYSIPAALIPQENQFQLAYQEL